MSTSPPNWDLRLRMEIAFMSKCRGIRGSSTSPSVCSLCVVSTVQYAEQITVDARPEVFSFTDGNCRFSRADASRQDARTDLIVVEAGIEATQVDLVIEQVIECVLESFGQQLGFEVDSSCKTRTSSPYWKDTEFSSVLAARP